MKLNMKNDKITGEDAIFAEILLADTIFYNLAEWPDGRLGLTPGKMYLTF